MMRVAYSTIGARYYHGDWGYPRARHMRQLEIA